MKKDQPVLSGQQPSQHREQPPGRRRQMIVAAAVAVMAGAITAAVALPGAAAQRRAATTSDLAATASLPPVTASRLPVTAARLTRSAAGPAAATGAPRTTAPLRGGQQGTRQDVPWSRVGRGWILATRTPGQRGNGPSTLFLIDPAGGRYRLGTLPAQDYLVAWSGDGRRALLDNEYHHPSQVAVLYLRTGTTAQFSLGSGVSPLGFSAPDGLAILANADVGSAQPTLERFSLNGKLEQTYPASFAGGGSYDGNAAVYSPDGTELAVSTTAKMELMSNDGHVIRALPVSKSAQECMPVRWWTTTKLLAKCPAPSGGWVLWLVPASGAAVTQLTASPRANGDDGDLDAWLLRSGTYVQDVGACANMYLAKLQPNGQTAAVKVPGVHGDGVFVIGSNADELALQIRTPCGAGSSLIWYSAAHGTTTLLLGGAAPGGGAVGAALLFGEPSDYLG